MITREQVDKLKKYDIIFRRADGVWCGPVFMGHFWIIEDVQGDDVTYCWVPDGWEVSGYQSDHKKKSDFVGEFLEIVEAPYYSAKWQRDMEEQHLKTRYEQALIGQFWCPECGKWHELPLHELSETTKSRGWVVY